MNDFKEKEFVDGLIVKAPRDVAPEFVKASLSIKRKELVEWLNKKQDEWINLDVKEGKSGKWYAEVNNWKPNKAAVEAKNSDDNYSLAADKNMSADEIPF